MARNLDDIYRIMENIMRKNRGAWLSPDDAMDYLDNGQLLKFEEDFKSYSINQTLHDSLRPFKVTNKYFVSDTGGNVAYESDYMHLLNAYTVYGSAICVANFVQSDEVVEARVSQLRPVLMDSPIIEDTGIGMKIYPESVHYGFYSYLKRPVKPVYVYTQVDRNINYDNNASTQLEWQDNYINSVIAYAMQYAGININDVGVYQFAQNLTKEASST